MSEEAPAAAARQPGGPPLPPDDRLWRHPSELGALSSDAPAEPSESRPRAWPVAALGVVAGAALATSGIVLTGSLSPRVVEQHVVEKVAVAPLLSPMLGDEGDVDDLIGRVSPVVVRVEAHREDEVTVASGLVFRDDGPILTIAHPLLDADRVAVVLADGRRLPGAVVGLDELTDVAVLDVDATGLPVAVLEISHDVEVGEVVVTIGAPADRSAPPSVAAGPVTGLDGWALLHGGPRLHGLVEIDVETDLHHEGGPVVDATGAVVGITTAASDERPAHGFAVPMHVAHRVALALLHDGKADHAWLGVEAVDLDDASRSALDATEGALVGEVVAGSPADLAGIEVGDVITHVDDRPVGSAAALVSALRRCAPGDTLTLQVLRGGAAHETEVVVAERPEG